MPAWHETDPNTLGPVARKFFAVLLVLRFFWLLALLAVFGVILWVVVSAATA